MSHFTTEQLRTMSWEVTNKTTQRLISDLIESRRERDEARREVERLRAQIAEWADYGVSRADMFALLKSIN